MIVMWYVCLLYQMLRCYCSNYRLQLYRLVVHIQKSVFVGLVFRWGVSWSVMSVYDGIVIRGIMLVLLSAVSVYLLTVDPRNA